MFMVVVFVFGCKKRGLYMIGNKTTNVKETQIYQIVQKLYQQQQALFKLIDNISKQIKPGCSQIIKPPPTIGSALNRFISKDKQNSEEPHRKYNVICKYITAVGLKLDDKYNKFHNEATLSNIINAIIARTDIKGNQKIRHARWITSFAKFAVFAYPDLYKTDVLVGLPLIEKTPKSERQPHTPYTDLQLKRIFDPSRKFFCKYPDLYWGCMIALFTGARKNAVFTLQYKDIFFKDGFWCINFIQDCPGIKKLKTEDSERIVPIHSTLIKMGFLDYIKRKMHDSNNGFIFEKICFNAMGNLNSHMVRNFFYFLERIGIRNFESVRYDFHSFRKNANIAMEKCGMIRSYIDKIIGWQSRGSEGERSYSNYTIKQLSDQLELLHYNCLKKEFKQWKKIMATIC